MFTNNKSKLNWDDDDFRFNFLIGLAIAAGAMFFALFILLIALTGWAWGSSLSLMSLTAMILAILRSKPFTYGHRINNEIEDA